MQSSTLLFVVLLAYCVTSSRVSALRCYKVRKVLGQKNVEQVEQEDCSGTCVEAIGKVKHPVTGGLCLLLYMDHS